MKNFLINNRHRLVLAVFLIIHGLTCLFTTIFGDDYYYAAFVKNGADYMISENIVHYTLTNGRALVHFIDELLLGYSFYIWRIVSVLVMWALIVGIARLAARTYRAEYNKEHYKNAVIAACALFAVTDIGILRQSVYWATGSLNYLFPATLTVWYVYLLRRFYERGRGGYVLIPMALVACATTEQASAAALLAVLWLIVSALIEKKRSRLIPLALNFVSALIGFLTLFLAPGNSARTQFYPDFYAMSILGRIKWNARELTGIVFGGDGIGAIIIAVFVVVIFKSLKKAPILSAITAAVAGIYIYALNIRTEIREKVWFLIIFAIPLVAVMIVTLVDYFKKKELDDLYFIWCAVAMQCAMSLAPEYGPRTLTISLIMLIIPTARVIIEEGSPMMYAALGASVFTMLPADMSSPDIFVFVLFSGVLALFIINRIYKFNILPLLAVTAAIAVFATVPAGYAQNLDALKKNEIALTSYDPAAGEPLTLYYLPNYTYKYTMPYDNKYHEVMLLRLYDIPDGTVVIYEWTD